MKYFSLKTMTTLVAVIALAIAGVQVLKHKKAAMQNIAPAKTYGLVVPVETAHSKAVKLSIPYLALVQSNNNVNLTSKLTSRVDMIVTSGSRVKKGGILVILDSADLVAKKKALESKIRQVGNQITAKETDLASLKSTHRRNQKLLEVQAISQQKLDTESASISSLQSTINSMKNDVESLDQNIAEINDTISYSTIKSPMDGVVSKTFLAKGGLATTGKPLLNLSGGDSKQFLVRVSDDIRPQALWFTDKTCPLHALNSTYNGLNEYSCQIQSSLPAGNRVEVKLIVFDGDNILMPSDSVLQINGKQYVLLVKDDKAISREIHIINEGSEGLLVYGVHEGDEYVVAKPDILLKLLTGIKIIRADS